MEIKVPLRFRKAKDSLYLEIANGDDDGHFFDLISTTKGMRLVKRK